MGHYHSTKSNYREYSDIFGTPTYSGTIPTYISKTKTSHLGMHNTKGKKTKSNCSYTVDGRMISVRNYKIKIDEFFNIVYDRLIGYNMEYILNKYPNKPTTLLVLNYCNWFNIFQQEFGNELSDYLLNNKLKFKALTMGVYEIRYLHCNFEDVKDRHMLNEGLFGNCLNNKTHKICCSIADNFWKFRLNNT